MFDPHAVASVFAQTDRELWLLTASNGERRGGLIATSVASASIVPELPRIVVGIGKSHFTWHLLQRNPAFVMHLLRQDQLDLAWRFAGSSGRDGDKFAGMEIVPGDATGCPRLAESAGWLECKVETSMDLGDRTLYVGEVVAGAWTGPSPPLTVQRMILTATPDQLRMLKAQMAEHAALDAEAIRAIRAFRAHRVGR